LRRKLPKATIVAGFWTLKKDEIEERNAVTLTGADLVAVSLWQAVEQVIDAVQAGADDHLNAETRAYVESHGSHASERETDGEGGSLLLAI
jgi:hypothetical protein